MGMLRFAVSCAALAGVAASALAHGTYHYRNPAPMGELLYAKPQVRWEIWGEGGLKVTGVRLLVNGAEVSAHYDQATKAVLYSPEAPLPIGKHTFECTVTLNGRHEARKDWTAIVRPDAATTLPPPTPQAVEAIEAMNRIRGRLGLVPAKMDLALTAASTLQTRLIAGSGNFDHIQGSGAEATPGQRAMMFGYSGSVSELLCAGYSSPTMAVRSLYDAPYHRIPMLSPSGPDFGASVRGDVSTLLLSQFGAGVTVSPADGETSVPTEWDGVESPNPMRDSSAVPPFGYPVVAGMFDQGEWSLLKAALTAPDGSPVEAVVRHPGNDPYADRAVILVPTKPLRPKATYRATVSFLSGTGTKTKSWSFTTAQR